MVGLLAASVFAPAGPPPPEPRNMPGELKGRIKTWWVAPYVSATTHTIGSNQATTVRWFTADVRFHREVAGARVTVQPGYVYAYGEEAVYAVNGDWKLTLPKKAGPAGYITATEDSRTFIHEFHPKEGQIAADVYVLGRLTRTIGPYVQYNGQDVQLGVDGSLALLNWRNEDKKVPQVAAFGRDGKLRFQVDCDGPVMSPVPAPDAAGVLVQANAGGEGRNTFTCYRKAGRLSSLNVGPNGRFVAWMPGTMTAVLQTSVGDEYRWHLTDWQAGTRLWDAADPSHDRVPGESPAVAVMKDYLLIGGREYGKQKEPARSIYAVDLKTGQVVAHWLPSPHQPSSDAGRFLKLGEKLFLVTDEEFADIDLAEIAAKKNGWK